MATIDVIIPVYNTAKFLDECLESIVNQDFKDWRGVLIDDCSTDGESSAKCDEWASKDSRFEVHHLPSNIGLSQVRNYGVSVMSAPYLTFVDSDDYLAENYLSSLYSAMKSGDYDISVTGIIEVAGKEEKVKICMQGIMKNPAVLREIIMDKKLKSYLHSKLFKKEMLEGIRFPDWRCFEDYATSPKIFSKANNVIFTDSATYYYRRHSDSITHVLKPGHFYDFFLSILERDTFINETDVLNDYTKKALKVWIIKSVMVQYRHLLKIPHSENREKVERIMYLKLKEFGIKFPDMFVIFKLWKYSIKKRYYECRFLYMDRFCGKK